ncbi:hypothetical protein MPTK1_8g12520 [Marchantia polymorpha subsp. ruderalis]|nr:hypothetical protein Mp_8g12520 [Marchantia polymorpha subsp. ruderalis]
MDVDPARRQDRRHARQFLPQCCKPHGHLFSPPPHSALSLSLSLSLGCPVCAAQSRRNIDQHSNVAPRPVSIARRAGLGSGLRRTHSPCSQTNRSRRPAGSRRDRGRRRKAMVRCRVSGRVGETSRGRIYEIRKVVQFEAHHRMSVVVNRLSLGGSLVARAFSERLAELRAYVESVCGWLVLA